MARCRQTQALPRPPCPLSNPLRRSCLSSVSHLRKWKLSEAAWPRRGRHVCLPGFTPLTRLLPPVILNEVIGPCVASISSPVKWGQYYGAHGGGGRPRRVRTYAQDTWTGARHILSAVRGSAAGLASLLCAWGRGRVQRHFRSPLLPLPPQSPSYQILLEFSLVSAC